MCLRDILKENKTRQKSRGFSLIEILVVLVIIIMMAAFTVPAFKVNEAQVFLKKQAELEAYLLTAKSEIPGQIIIKIEVINKEEGVFIKSFKNNDIFSRAPMGEDASMPLNKTIFLEKLNIYQEEDMDKKNFNFLISPRGIITLGGKEVREFDLKLILKGKKNFSKTLRVKSEGFQWLQEE